VTAVVADGRGRRTLTLRAPVAFAALWLAPRLGAFEAAHPDIDLRLQTEVWPGDGELGAVDAEIRHGAGRWPGAVAQRLSRDRLTLAVHPDHARADPLATIEAAGGLITVVGYSSGWPAWFAALDLTPPTLTAWPVDSELVAAAAAEAGRGAVLARLPLYTRLIDTGRLVTPFADSAVEEGFFLLADPDRLRSSVGDDFAGWLRAAFSEPGASTAVAVGRTDPETGR
jgi:DNA-binding transcriptional LysR family regulator